MKLSVEYKHEAIELDLDPKTPISHAAERAAKLAGCFGDQDDCWWLAKGNNAFVLPWQSIGDQFEEGDRVFLITYC